MLRQRTSASPVALARRPSARQTAISIAGCNRVCNQQSAGAKRGGRAERGWISQRAFPSRYPDRIGGVPGTCRVLQGGGRKHSGIELGQHGEGQLSDQAAASAEILAGERNPISSERRSSSGSMTSQSDAGCVLRISAGFLNPTYSFEEPFPRNGRVSPKWG